MKERDDLLLVSVSDQEAVLKSEGNQGESSVAFPKYRLFKKVAKALDDAANEPLQVRAWVDPDDSLNAMSDRGQVYVQVRSGKLAMPSSVTQRPGPQETPLQRAVGRDLGGPRHEHQPPPAPRPPRQGPAGGGVTSRAASKLDRNPYNFAGLEGKAPWKPEEPAPTHVQLKEDQNRLLSGRIVLQYEAATPVALAASPMTNARGELRHAIAGSSLKGAVRTFFEALTNSRMGVFERERYEKPIPYRRRAAQAWVVVGGNAATGFQVVRYRVAFGEKRGSNFKVNKCPERESPWRKDQEVPAAHWQSVPNANPGVSLQAVPYRANLYWQPPSIHTHRHTHLLLQATGERATISPEVYEQYKDNLDHDSFRDHLANVADVAANYRKYKASYYSPGSTPVALAAGRAVNYELAKKDLAHLEPGSVIFGMAEAGQIRCFGKNVNFLWPSRKSIIALLDQFLPREQKASLTDSDLAERVFGFAGVRDVGGHPFRGRVRFTTLWGPDEAEMRRLINERGVPDGANVVPGNPAAGEMTRVSLDIGALVSPKVRAKARPLYLKPAPGGESASFEDTPAEPELRGRKMYWHQKTAEARNIPSFRPVAGERSERFGTGGLLPSVIPTGATFSGEVHFEGLTPTELGALLTSLNPALLEGPASTSRYAIHLGKAKPRGFGSLEARQLSLELRRKTFDLESLDNAEMPEVGNTLEETLEALRGWACRCAGKASFDQIGVIRDLKALSVLPSGATSRDYPELKETTWSANWDDINGDPHPGERPTAMRSARDIGRP